MADQTPALARATGEAAEALALRWGVPKVDGEMAAVAARAAVSAALHDPDDPDALAKAIDPGAFEDHGHLSETAARVIIDRRQRARRAADAVRAAILGGA